VRRLLAAYTALLAALIYAPMAVMALQSFNESPYLGSWEGFTLEWYTLLLRDGEVHRALANSVAVAAASSGLSVAMALLAGAAVRRKPGVTPIDFLVYPPLVLPEIVEAVSLLMFLAALGAPFGPLTVVIGHTAFNVAYAYIVIAPALKDASRFEDAARTLGATPLRAAATVTLKLAAPGLASAAMLTALLSFTDFIKTLFTTGPGFETLPLLLWNRARRPGLRPESSHSALAALATAMIAATLLVAAAYTLVALRGRGALERRG